jgi:hypothetical protein
MSVLRQVAINHISRIVPDVLEVIKSFCFYDTATAFARDVHRERTAWVTTELRETYMTRGHETSHISHPDTDEFWLVNLDITEIEETIISAKNCRICGNYLYSSSWKKFATRSLELDGLHNNFVSQAEYDAVLRERIRLLIPNSLLCKCCR